jgi:hypothetical protein
LTNSHKIDIFQSGIHRVAVQYFFVFWRKAWGQRKTFLKYRQSQEKDLTPLTPFSKCVFLPESEFPLSSLRIEDFNPKSIKSYRPFSHPLRSNLRLLCKSLSFMASIKNSIPLISDIWILAFDMQSSNSGGPLHSLHNVTSFHSTFGGGSGKSSSILCMLVYELYAFNKTKGYELNGSEGESEKRGLSG